MQKILLVLFIFSTILHAKSFGQSTQNSKCQICIPCSKADSAQHDIEAGKIAEKQMFLYKSLYEKGQEVTRTAQLQLETMRTLYTKENQDKVTALADRDKAIEETKIVIIDRDRYKEKARKRNWRFFGSLTFNVLFIASVVTAVVK